MLSIDLTISVISAVHQMFSFSNFASKLVGLYNFLGHQHSYALVLYGQFFDAVKQDDGTIRCYLRKEENVFKKDAQRMKRVLNQKLICGMQ